MPGCGVPLVASGWCPKALRRKGSFPVDTPSVRHRGNDPAAQGTDLVVPGWELDNYFVRLPINVNGVDPVAAEVLYEIG